MGWTEERVALLRKLWVEGLSASQIAKQLGSVTRNAVIGKVHRLGLAGRTTPSRPAKRPVRAARPRPAVTTAPRMRPPSVGISPLPALPQLEPMRFEDGSFATVLTLTEQMCKFPIGDPQEAGFAFCGRPNNGCSSYCAEHAQVTYQPSQARRRRTGEGQDQLRRLLRAEAA